AWLLLVIVVCSACAGSTEEIVLERFFNASRLRDTTQLRSLGTVIFEPRQQGTVLRFEIEQIDREPVRRVNNAEDRGVTGISFEGVDGAPAEAAADQLEVEHVTALASVRGPDGQIKARTLTITIERAARTIPPIVTGRWVVTGIAPG